MNKDHILNALEENRLRSRNLSDCMMLDNNFNLCIKDGVWSDLLFVVVMSRIDH